MARHSSSDPKCPRCAGELKRRHRTADEAREGSDFRRYRCLDAACGWDGILPRPVHRFRGPRRSRSASSDGDVTRSPLTTQVWLIMGGLFVVLVIVASMLMHLAFRQEPGVLATGTPVNAETTATPKPAPALQPRQ